MSNDMIFQTGTFLAVAGWVALLFSPLMPRLSDVLAGYVIPGVIAVVYTGLILAFFATAEGGFGSLDEVAQLFQTREMLLAGWLHYLAFDLFVGAWIARKARAEGISFWAVLPCLPLTFMFGPVGYLAFLIVRLAMQRRHGVVAAEGRPT